MLDLCVAVGPFHIASLDDSLRTMHYVIIGDSQCRLCVSIHRYDTQAYRSGSCSPRGPNCRFSSLSRFCCGWPEYELPLSTLYSVCTRIPSSGWLPCVFDIAEVRKCGPGLGDRTRDLSEEVWNILSSFKAARSLFLRSFSSSSSKRTKSSLSALLRLRVLSRDMPCFDDHFRDLAALSMPLFPVPLVK